MAGAPTTGLGSTMRRGPTRPPGPPPLRLELWLRGVDRCALLELDRESEPDVVGRVEQLVRERAYDGVALRVRPDLVELNVPTGWPHRRVEPRRIRHSV